MDTPAQPLEGGRQLPRLHPRRRELNVRLLPCSSSCPYVPCYRPCLSGMQFSNPSCIIRPA